MAQFPHKNLPGRTQLAETSVPELLSAILPLIVSPLGTRLLYKMKLCYVLLISLSLVALTTVLVQVRSF